MAMAPVNSIRRWDFNIGQFPLGLPLISANRRIAELAISTSALQSTAGRRNCCYFEKKMHRWKAKILLFRTSKKLQTFSPKATLETRKKTHAPNLSVQPGTNSHTELRTVSNTCTNDRTDDPIADSGARPAADRHSRPTHRHLPHL